MRRWLVGSTIVGILAAVACGSSTDATGEDSAGGDGGVADGATSGDGGTNGEPGADGSAGASDGGTPCSGDGWCWVNPLPQGNTLNAVHVASGADAWAVGLQGTVLRWNGSVWSRTPTPSKKELTGVWASGPNDAWATGREGELLRWNGQAWTHVDAAGNTFDLHAVWGSAPNDVWAVGYTGRIFHFDGTTWALTKGGPGVSDRFLSVHGTAANDVWIAGGSVHRWEGVKWTTQAGVTGEHVWTPAKNDVWVAGTDGKVSHYDGQSWTPRPIPITANDIVTSIGGSSPTDVWASLRTGGFMQWTNGAWQPVAAGTKNELSAVRTTGTEGWAVGAGGVLLRRSGASWTVASTGATTRTYQRVWGTSPTDIWVVGDEGTILHGDGTTFTPSPSNVSYTLYDVGGVAPNDVWATGEVPLHFDGASWTPKADGLGPERITRVWAAAANDVFGVWSTVRRWNGSTWVQTTGNLSSVNNQLNGNPFGMWGASANDVWVVGEKGLMMRWKDGAWGPATSGVTQRLWDVHGSGPSDVWAVYFGGATHFDGNAWTPHPTTPENYRSVFAVSPTDAWLVGGNGAIQHWDGATWTASETGASTFLTSVWASGPNDVWAVGTNGTILHRRR